MSKKVNNSYIAYPDRGAGNDPEALGLAFHHQGPTFINAYHQAATDMVNWDWGQYGSNDLPRPKRSAFSKCFVGFIMESTYL